MKDSIYVPIGERMAKIRRSHHMTQEVLAGKLGVTPKHISHSERGVSSLSLKQLIAFCELFECSLDYLILGNINDPILSLFPESIINLVCTGTPQEIQRFQRYLSVYVEFLEDPKDI